MKDSGRSKASWTAVAATASLIFAGCASSKLTSTPQASGADAPPKKEYQWKDMSQGKSFYGPRLSATGQSPDADPK